MPIIVAPEKLLTRTMLHKIITLTALSGFWLLGTFNSAPTDFSYYDRLFIGVLFLFILSAQATIATCCKWLFSKHGNVIANIALAIFTVVNMTLSYLVFYTPFASLILALQLILLLIFMWIAYKGWTLIDEIQHKKIAPILATVLFGSVLTVAITNWQLISAGNFNLQPIKQGMTSSPDIKIVDFVKKPNVYFLSFDSLIPRSLAKKYLKINELAYQDALENHGFRLFENFFADAVYTRKSLSNFLSLGVNSYSKEQEQKNKYLYANSFTGIIPSPLLEIFKANGYTTNAYYNDPYFGYTKGKYMDNYHINIPFVTCTFLTDFASHAGFWGYCPLLAMAINLNIFGIVNSVKPVYSDFLVTHATKALHLQQHSVFIAYLWSPGHVFPHYYNRPEQLERYRKKFRNGDNTTANRINILMKFIKQNDPEALVFIFGDHGPRLTDYFPWDTMETENDKIFFIQDRYGVLGGVYPKDACEDSFARPYKADYNTPAQVGRQIIRCLSGGQDPFLTSPSYDLDYDIEGYQGTTPLQYEDFLYE